MKPTLPTERLTAPQGAAVPQELSAAAAPMVQAPTAATAPPQGVAVSQELSAAAAPVAQVPTAATVPQGVAVSQGLSMAQGLSAAAAPVAQVPTAATAPQAAPPQGAAVSQAPREIYLPDVVGGGYGSFWRCRARYRVLKGGKGSKKSATTALNLIVRLMQHPDANLLVVRKVGDTHRTSTFAQLRWAIRRLGVEPFWKATTSPLELTYTPTGQKILFRGLDDPLKLASTAVERGVLCWVWIEEAFEIESEAAFDKLDLSVPRGRVPAPLFKQTTLTFNPWSGSHWLKRRFFDAPGAGVAAFTTTYRCNEWLDDTDRAVFDRMRRENPRLYRVAGLGEWGAAEGLIYDRWEVRDFDVDRVRRMPPARAAFGLDYGYTNDPTALFCGLVLEEKRLLFVFDELYERGLTNREIYARIRDKGYAKERIRADSAEPKSNDELRFLGLRGLRPAAKGPDSVRSGIQHLQGYRMLVHPRCVHFIEEIGGYAWDVDRDGRPINRPAGRDDHLMDAMRYAMEPFVRRRAGRQTDRTGAARAAGPMQGGWDV